MKKKNGKAPILTRITIDDEKVKFGLKTEPTPLIWDPQSGPTEEALQLNRDLDGIKRLDITQSTLNKYDLTFGQQKEFVKMIYVMRQLDITPNYIKLNSYVPISKTAQQPKTKPTQIKPSEIFLSDGFSLTTTPLRP